MTNRQPSAPPDPPLHAGGVANQVVLFSRRGIFVEQAQADRLVVDGRGGRAGTVQRQRAKVVDDQCVSRLHGSWHLPARVASAAGRQLHEAGGTDRRRRCLTLSGRGLGPGTPRRRRPGARRGGWRRVRPQPRRQLGVVEAGDDGGQPLRWWHARIDTGPLLHLSRKLAVRDPGSARRLLEDLAGDSRPDGPGGFGGDRRAVAETVGSLAGHHPPVWTSTTA